MDCVRIGVIGVGNMGTSHAKNIASGKVENAKLTAVCDANPARLAWFKANMPDVKVFENEDQLMDSKEVDAVVVATGISCILPSPSRHLKRACMY